MDRVREEEKGKSERPEMGSKGKEVGVQWGKLGGGNQRR